MAENIEFNFNINSFLEKAVKLGVSDIHLSVGEVPMVRLDGKILKVKGNVITSGEMNTAIMSIIPPIIKNRMEFETDLDFSYSINGLSRFRVNLLRTMGEYALVLRVIPLTIKSITNLHLPSSLKKFADYNNGLIVVTGQTGSGKSTTLAALIEYINETYQKHIITIEDPVEFVFKDKKSAITQRQVQVDTPSYMQGIKYALRQDPDVILIGEIRDRETLDTALKAAETGHLVFATMHTNDAVQTINRMVNMYDASSRDLIRIQIAESLRGTISQKLIKKAKEQGRYPACEILSVTPAIKDFIIKDKLDDVYELMSKNSFDNMITMNQSIYELTKTGNITKESALEASDNKIELEQFFRGVQRNSAALEDDEF